MSDNGNRYISGQDGAPQNELLDELGSLKDLLDEEIERSAAITSVNEISSVKEYMLLKQEAEKAGLDLDNYLSQRAESSQGKISAEEMIPVLEEIVNESQLPGSHLKTPPPQPEARSPNPSNQSFASALGSPSTRLEAVEQLVERTVQQKLDEIKPQLEKQVFDQIRNMLPLDFFK